MLKCIYKYDKNNCLFNERYIAQMLHLAIPTEFDSVVVLENESQCFDELSEVDIRTMWSESFETKDSRELNF